MTFIYAFSAGVRGIQKRHFAGLISSAVVVMKKIHTAPARPPSPFARAKGRFRHRWAEGQSGVGRQIRLLLDIEANESPTLLFSTGLAMAAAWIFLSILESVVSAGPLNFADSRIYQGLQHLRSPFRDSVIVAITELGDPLVVAAVAIAVSLWLAFRRRWRAAAYWVGAISIAQILNTFTKLIVQRPRPGIFDYAEASRFSFPSGHATMNSVMYAFLALLLVQRISPPCRAWIVAAALSLASLIAFSRLYLGAHWFSDVAGSLALATSCVIVLGTSYRRNQEHPPNARALGLVACVTLAIVGGIHIHRNHATDIKRYAIQHASQANDAQKK